VIGDAGLPEWAAAALAIAPADRLEAQWLAPLKQLTREVLAHVSDA
jgi:hypothetical protein